MCFLLGHHLVFYLSLITSRRVFGSNILARIALTFFKELLHSMKISFPLLFTCSARCTCVLVYSFKLVPAKCSPPTDQVEFSSYGTPTGQCGQFKVGECNSKTSLAVVTALCVGKNNCTIAANTETFGDPCQGKTKQFAVQVVKGNLFVFFTHFLLIIFVALPAHPHQHTIHKHTDTATDTDTQTHRHTHTHTCAHMHKHTHRHTLTQYRLYCLSCLI